MKRLLVTIALLLAPFWAQGQTLTFSSPGQTSITIPPGVTSINFAAYGNGDGGTNFSSPQSNGAGGGFCQSQLAVTPGQTVYVQVANPAGPSGSLVSWVNISSNAAPGSSAHGCEAFGQNKNVADNCSSGVGSNQCVGAFGAVNNFGGPAGSSASPLGGAGGGGPGGPGQGASGAAGGAGGPAAALGTPPHVFPAGGSGGTGGAGSAPGGGAANVSVGGSNGEVIVVYVFTPLSSGASQMFMTWPG